MRAKEELTKGSGDGEGVSVAAPTGGRAPRSETNGEAAASVRGLSKSFKGTRVLEDVSFDVAEGEALVLLGASGSGKTTILRIIAGLEQPDGGRVVLHGKDVTALPARERGVGVIFQSYALFPRMTVEKNIAYGLRIRKRPREETKEAVERLLKLVRLDLAARRAADIDTEAPLHEAIANAGAATTVSTAANGSTEKRTGTPIFVTRPKPEASATPLRPGDRVAVGLTAFRVLPNYALASERASRVVDAGKEESGVGSRESE